MASLSAWLKEFPMAASRHVGGIVIMVVLTVASAAMFLMPRLTRPDAATPSPSPTASASVEQVIEFYRQVVEANPQDMKAQLILGNACFDQKDYGGAIKAYQAVLAMDPTNVNARVDMATAYYYEKVYAVALVQLKKAQAQEPNNVHALYNLGVVHHSMGQFEEARTHWQRASQLATDPVVKAQIDERLQRASKNPFK
jgi:cytochrome c-type biogenesis protein CcmH/NrfG